MDAWMDGWMDAWMIDGWMDGRMDRWMHGWMDGWTEGWMDVSQIIMQLNGNSIKTLFRYPFFLPSSSSLLWARLGGGTGSQSEHQ